MAVYRSIVQTKRLLLFIGVFLCSFYVLSHRDGCDCLYLSPGVYTLRGGSRLSTSECDHGVTRYIYLQINTVMSASLQNSSCTGCAASGAREGSCCPHTGWCLLFTGPGLAALLRVYLKLPWVHLWVACIFSSTEYRLLSFAISLSLSCAFSFIWQVLLTVH